MIVCVMAFSLLNSSTLTLVSLVPSEDAPARPNFVEGFWSELAKRECRRSACARSPVGQSAASFILVAEPRLL